MIARQEQFNSRSEMWAALAAPLPTSSIAWRQDGKPVNKDGKYFARFVAYIEANTVRERLDSVVAGEWDLTLDALPVGAVADRDGSVDSDTQCAFKARLQVLGVIREDVGHGKDWKQAATDAFKRAAVRFGIGHELYDFEMNWVEVDGDGKYAKPVEDPGAAYARRHGNGTQPPSARERVAQARPTSVPSNPTSSTDAGGADAATATASADDLGPCPKCGGPVWDNRLTKRNPKAPDGKCRNRSCDGVIWPPKNGKKPVRGNAMDADDTPYMEPPVDDDSDQIPF